MVRPFRRRYLAFRLSPAPLASNRELLATLTGIITAAYGMRDMEQSHIRVIMYDQTTGVGVVRCNHRNIDLLRSILNDSAEAFGVRRIETIGVSGTLKALRRFLAESGQGGV